MLNEIFESFSHPPGPDNEVLSLIIGQTGASVVRQALQLSGETLDGHLAELTAWLQEWLDAPGDVFWHPTISQLQASLKSREKERLSKWLVETGFLALLDGSVGSWSFNFEQPTQLWIDRWLFLEIVGGTVQSDGQKIQLTARKPDGSVELIVLARDTNAGRWVRSERCEITLELAAVELTPSNRVLLMPSEMMGADLLPQYLGASFKDAGSVGPFAECLKKSADLLQAHAPDYLDWVAEVIKFIAPVSAPADLIGSSSSPRFFGMISISDNSRPLSVAEFLVHEASHQYFIIAASLGEMDEGSEGQLFYSRFARRDRPLERILAAFHALANMALFYERCLADGVPCEGRLAYMATHMRELDEILRNAETLSPLGKSLWLPLSQKTRHLDMKADETISNAVLAESDRVMASLRRQPA